MARAILIHPHFALARWTPTGIRTSQMPDDLREYLLGDAVGFPPSEESQKVEVGAEDVEASVWINATVHREPGAIESDDDLFDALSLLTNAERFGVRNVVAVEYVPEGPDDWR
ncbi:MAG: hypothetical protein OXN97_13140 [Bryobacterales bacterium]|nr:hypothetical protein [Bryobacterales bacterium]